MQLQPNTHATLCVGPSSSPSLLFLGKLLDYNFYPICDRNGVKSLTKFANQFFSLISNWMSGFPVHSSSFYDSSLFALLEHPKEVHRRKKESEQEKGECDLLSSHFGA
jgi:hypothetical protein